MRGVRSSPLVRSASPVSAPCRSSFASRCRHPVAVRLIPSSARRAHENSSARIASPAAMVSHPGTGTASMTTPVDNSPNPMTTLEGRTVAGRHNSHRPCQRSLGNREVFVRCGVTTAGLSATAANNRGTDGKKRPGSANRACGRDSSQASQGLALACPSDRTLARQQAGKPASREAGKPGSRRTH